jgi:hypothetical protein
VTAPVGAVVRIWYDGRPVAPGDVLQKPTGRCYTVASVRVQRRGKHVGRQHLACLVTARNLVDVVARGGRIRPLRWYPRRRER